MVVDAEMAAGAGLPAADSASLNHRRELHVHGRPNDAYSLGRCARARARAPAVCVCA